MSEKINPVVEPTPSLATSARIASAEHRHASVNWDHAPEWAQYYQTRLRFGSQSSYWMEQHPDAGQTGMASKRQDAPVYFELEGDEVPFVSQRPHPTQRLAVDMRLPLRPLPLKITAAEEALVLAVRGMISEKLGTESAKGEVL